MKKILFTALAMLMLVGCSNEEQDNSIPQEITVNLDYTFWESGSMTRSGADLYTDFYNKYIKTKQLTPTTYTLSLRSKDMTKPTIINGYWKNKDGIRLVEGTYSITGSSTPIETKVFVDSLALSFNENVTITKETTSITLTAIHSSYMLMFDAINIKSIEYSDYSTGGYGTFNLKNVDNIFYLFINHKPETSDEIVITRKDNTTTTINTYGMPFEKGKYYYFNDVTNSFDIPPMEGGN